MVYLYFGAVAWAAGLLFGVPPLVLEGRSKGISHLARFRARKRGCGGQAEKKDAKRSPVRSFLFLIAMPFAPSSFLFLVVRPGAPSSILVPSSKARSP